jgi:hypothetical protein
MGTSVDDFLKEEGIFDIVPALSCDRAPRLSRQQLHRI